MKLVGLKKLGTGRRLSSLGGALLSLTLGAGCGDGTVDMTQPDLSPRTLFDTKALPAFKQTCASCHNVAQGSIAAFLPAGTEYSAITGYKMGSFINVPASN